MLESYCRCWMGSIVVCKQAQSAVSRECNLLLPQICKHEAWHLLVQSVLASNLWTLCGWAYCLNQGWWCLWWLIILGRHALVCHVHDIYITNTLSQLLSVMHCCMPLVAGCFTNQVWFCSAGPIWEPGLYGLLNKSWNHSGNLLWTGILALHPVLKALHLCIPCEVLGVESIIVIWYLCIEIMRGIHITENFY